MSLSPALRAALVGAWDAARPVGEDWPAVVAVSDPAPPEGFTAWTTHPPRAGSGQVAVLPALLPTAPPAVARRYMARVLASLTGACPLCSAVVTLSGPDPERTPAAWLHLPVVVGMTHAPDCPAIFTEADRAHLDPRALGDGPP